jgi:hypothetical protein
MLGRTSKNLLYGPEFCLSAFVLDDEIDTNN